VRAELGGNDVADRRGRLPGGVAVAIPQLAERAHRRDGAEAGAEALYPSAFVVDAHRQRGLALALDVCRQGGELLGALVIAREEDRGASGGMPNAAHIVVGQRRAEHVHHDRPERQPYFAHSRMTVAKATPRSSESETCAEVTPFASR